MYEEEKNAKARKAVLNFQGGRRFELVDARVDPSTIVRRFGGAAAAAAAAAGCVARSLVLALPRARLEPGA